MAKSPQNLSQLRVGKAIRARRSELGISLAALASDLGVSTSSLSKLENGLTPITFERPRIGPSINRVFTAGLKARLPKDWLAQLDYSWSQNTSGHYFQIVVRRDEDLSLALGSRSGSQFRFQRVVSGALNARSIFFNAPGFRRRHMRGDVNFGHDASPLRGGGDSKSMVAVGGGDHAPGRLITIERKDFVAGAPQLEGTGLLQILQLEEKACARIGQKIGNRFHRRFSHERANALRCVLNH